MKEVFENSEKFNYVWERLVFFAKYVARHTSRIDPEDLVAEGLAEIAIKFYMTGNGDSIKWGLFKTVIRRRYYEQVRRHRQNKVTLLDHEGFETVYRRLNIHDDFDMGKVESREELKAVKLGIQHLPGYLARHKNVELYIHCLVLIQYLEFSWEEAESYLGTSLNRQMMRRGRALLQGWCHALIGNHSAHGVLDYWRYGFDAGLEFIRISGQEEITITTTPSLQENMASAMKYLKEKLHNNHNNRGTELSFTFDQLRQAFQRSNQKTPSDADLRHTLLSFIEKDSVKMIGLQTYAFTEGKQIRVAKEGSVKKRVLDIASVLQNRGQSPFCVTELVNNSEGLTPRQVRNTLRELRIQNIFVQKGQGKYELRT